MLKTINKNDYTSQYGKIRINKHKNTISLYGVCGCPKWEIFKIKKCNTDTWQVLHNGWNYPLLYANQENGYFKAYNSYIERNNPCIYTAIAQVLYNIL